VNIDERINYLKNIIEELEFIREDYKQEYPGDHMLCLAINFINSLLTLEIRNNNVTPIRNYLGNKK